MTPSEDIQKAVKKYIDQVGVTDAAKEIGIAKETLARLAGGLGVHSGTVALVKDWMKRNRIG